MNTSSEYAFPIFISSTDYNLKDLRAELAKFLSDLGYRPILSSAEGFPDSSPTLEPWESCLPVLDKSFVMVLIIDGEYGTALPWPNFKEYFGDERISPTHGEYAFAHKTRKRMMVFIRKSLMPHYQSYRTTLENCNNNKEEAKKTLSPTLPKYVSFETLDFINKVKTTKPIPWINEFDDITCVKKEIQKKMLNELAEIFLIKDKHVEITIDAFNKVMDSLSVEQQKVVLSKINATKELKDSMEQIEGYKKELEESKNELEKAKDSNTKNKEKFEKKINSLIKKIDDLESETQKSSNSQFFIKDGQVKLGNPNFEYAGTLKVGGAKWSNVGEDFSGGQYIVHTYPKRCDKCGSIDNPATMAFTNSFRFCSKCNKTLCRGCWPSSFSIGAPSSMNVFTIGETCPSCS